MIVDPIQSAIAAYKGIDDVFRQDRLDEERRQQQGFQNNLALSQDQRAQESHQLLKDKADKQQKLADVQSLRHRAATKSLTDEDLTIMKQDPYLKKFFEDTSLIDEHLAAVGQIHADAPTLLQSAPSQHDDPKEWIKTRLQAKDRILNNLTLLTKDQLLQRNPNNPNEDVKLTNAVFSGEHQGLAIEAEFKKKNGETVNGVLTEGKSSRSDDPVKFYNVKDIMTGVTNNGKMLAGLKAALEARAIQLGDTALSEGLNKVAAGRIQNEQEWVGAEDNPNFRTLLDDPVMGAAFKNITAVTKAFGGSPKEALVKAQGVIEKVQTLAADKAEGQAFISTFSGIMEAAGKNPSNPYGSMVEFFNSNPAMVGRKGAVEAVKAAQAAIASDRKNKSDQRRDELGWAKVSAIAAKSNASAANSGSKAANQEKRDIAVRLRDAQRSYAVAVKSGDPTVINEAIDLLEYTNDQAKSVGVPLVKIPSHRESAEDTEAFRLQAVENLKAQRGAVGRLFNSSPSPKAVEAEMQRLRKTGTVPASQTAQAAATQQAPAPAAPAQQQSGKAFLSGNQVSVNGQSYPMNPDGTVTISGRKYRVQ
jgi:hypothetical protein